MKLNDCGSAAATSAEMLRLSVQCHPMFDGETQPRRRTPENARRGKAEPYPTVRRQSR
jgi:hypothetical protein